MSPTHFSTEHTFGFAHTLSNTIIAWSILARHAMFGHVLSLAMADFSRYKMSI
jgi:hypothetical protein